MLNTGMSLSGAGKGSSRSMSLGWKVEGKGWMEASIRTKVTEKRPEAGTFSYSCCHSGHTEHVDTTLALKKEYQDLGCICCTQVKPDRLGMEGRLRRHEV